MQMPGEFFRVCFVSFANADRFAFVVRSQNANGAIAVCIE
jgi:hypothetical protein